ncbi:PPOX class F420-dependent oxidoreductase [Streptosporangium sp. DT93]|uniref:PPOX class F420-dependent oxidoreductase n=1 Tax=Streptosporangium sp. DT93 TaxID=3393428 RepID=UPI00362201FC
MAILPDGARDLFDAVNFATVTSLNADGGPHASVVWARTDGDDILFSTLRGRRKDVNFRRDPRTAIVAFDHADPYRYAEVRGRVVLADDPEGALIEEMSRKYTGKAWVEAHPGARRVIVRIVPEHVFYRG